MIGTVGVPIVVEGATWGLMVGAARPGTRIPNGTEARLARFTELVATAIANSQAREHLARLANQQAALRRIATMVAHDLRRRRCSPRSLGRWLCSSGLESAAVFSYGPAGEATMVGKRGDPEHGFRLGGRYGLDGYNVTARIYQTGLSARIDDYERASGSIGAVGRQAGLRSGVGSPILVNGRLWGALAAVTARSGPLTSGCGAAARSVHPARSDGDLERRGENGGAASGRRAGGSAARGNASGGGGPVRRAVWRRSRRGRHAVRCRLHAADPLRVGSQLRHPRGFLGGGGRTPGPPNARASFPAISLRCSPIRKSPCVWMIGRTFQGRLPNSAGTAQGEVVGRVPNRGRGPFVGWVGGPLKE